MNLFMNVFKQCMLMLEKFYFCQDQRIYCMFLFNEQKILFFGIYDKKDIVFKVMIFKKVFCKCIYLFVIFKKCLKILQKINIFLELVKVLSYFCRNLVFDDFIVLEVVVLLGRLCVDDDNVRAELKRFLESIILDIYKKVKVRFIIVYYLVIWKKY